MDNKFNIGAYILRPYARTEIHIKDIKDAMIDFIVSLDYDKKTLDMLSEHSIFAILTGVLPNWWGGDGEKSGEMEKSCPLEKYKTALDEYVHHSAVWGIDMGDEISSKDFPYLEKIVNLFETKNITPFPYTNLYANYGVYATSDESERQRQWGCKTYREYIEKYCQTVPLDYVCFDHYPYSCENTDLYLENLSIVSDACKKYGKEMWVVGQVSSSDKKKVISLEQMRFQILNAIKYGAKTFMWACYTGGWWHNHPISQTGEKTSLYEDLKRVNAEAKEFFEKTGKTVL